MLEAVDTIVTNGKIYMWAENVVDMVKTICERCQETGGIIKFPSLILWIVMYHIFPSFADGFDHVSDIFIPSVCPSICRNGVNNF